MGKTVLPLFLSYSWSDPFHTLQVTMTYMRALMSLKFGQIRLLVPMATDRVIMEKTVLPLFLSCFSSHSFLYLQVMMTCMRARTRSNFGQIRPRAAELRPLKDVRNWFLLNILRMDGQNLTKFCITHYHWQDLYCYCKASFFTNLQQSYRLTALDRCQILVFAQYLENGWTEIDQILYTLYHWQDLCLYCKGLFFTNLPQSYSPWLMSDIVFAQYLENG